MENNVRTHTPYSRENNRFSDCSDEQNVIPLVFNGEVFYTEKKPALPSFLISDDDLLSANEKNACCNDAPTHENAAVNDILEKHAYVSTEHISVSRHAAPAASAPLEVDPVASATVERTPIATGSNKSSPAAVALTKPVSVTISPAINTIFAQRRICVVRKNYENISKGVSEFAEFIAGHYDVCSDLYREIRSSFVRDGRRGEYNRPDGMSNSKWNNIIAVFEHLFEYGIFSHHSHNMIKLTFTTAEPPNVQNFFNGAYLELYATSIAQQVVPRVASEFGIDDYEISRNVVIEHHNGATNELDLVIRIGDKLFWSEVKNGSCTVDISKYWHIGKSIGVNPKHHILLWAAANDGKCDVLSHLYECYVANIASFTKNLEAMLRHGLSVEKQ